MGRPTEAHTAGLPPAKREMLRAAVSAEASVTQKQWGCVNWPNLPYTACVFWVFALPQIFPKGYPPNLHSDREWDLMGELCPLNIPELTRVLLFYQESSQWETEKSIRKDLMFPRRGPCSLIERQIANSVFRIPVKYAI